MSGLFKNIPVTVTEPKSNNYRKKILAMLMDVGGNQNIKNVNSKYLPLKKPRLIKEDQK